MKNEIDNKTIKELYLSWYNAPFGGSSPLEKRKRLEELKTKVSPYEFLMYCSSSMAPFATFKKIYSLPDLFNVLEGMVQRGESLEQVSNCGLAIREKSEVEFLSRYARRNVPKQIRDLEIYCNGIAIFEYGDAKIIGQKFENAIVNRLNIEQIETLMEKRKDYKGIPIRINIENMCELPRKKLDKISGRFDIDSIKIVGKNKEGTGHQGEQFPYTLDAYKQAREIVDGIISNIYVPQMEQKTSRDRMAMDYYIATQVVDNYIKIVKEYDHDAKERFSEKSVNASTLVGLLQGKAICAGDAETLRNIFGCVGIQSKVIAADCHEWLQVKLGDDWHNLDVTWAREDIKAGRPSGYLFADDEVFYGVRRKTTYDSDIEVQGTNLECTVFAGGHKRASNVEVCDTRIPPMVTFLTMERARKYSERYKAEGHIEGYKGPVPYVGSKIEKERAISMDIKKSDDIER